MIFYFLRSIPWAVVIGGAIAFGVFYGLWMYLTHEQFHYDARTAIQDTDDILTLNITELDPRQRKINFARAVNNLIEIGTEKKYSRVDRAEALFRVGDLLLEGLPRRNGVDGTNVEPWPNNAVSAYCMAGSVGFSRGYRRAVEVIRNNPQLLQNVESRVLMSMCTRRANCMDQRNVDTTEGAPAFGHRAAMAGAQAVHDRRTSSAGVFVPHELLDFYVDREVIQVHLPQRIHLGDGQGEDPNGAANGHMQMTRMRNIHIVNRGLPWLLEQWIEAGAGHRHNTTFFTRTLVHIMVDADGVPIGVWNPIGLDVFENNNGGGGAQNVHDSDINRGFGKIIPKLVSDMIRTNKMKIITSQRKGWMGALRQSLRDEQFDDLRAEARVDAQKTFTRIEQTNARDVATNVCEIDLLGMVWARIHEHTDAMVRKNSRETLFKNFATGVEKGSVVCQKGRLGRLIAALQAIDPSVERVMTATQIREIFFDAAARIRERVLGALSIEDTKIYENDLDGTSPLMIRIKELIRRGLFEDVVDRKELMTAKAFEQQFPEVLEAL